MKDDNVASGAVYYMKDMTLEVFGDFDRLEPIATEIAINYSLRGADAYYLAVAELTKSKLHTFDKQQEEAFEAITKTW
jgi:predicted nucleic acid-binding protein